MITVYPTKENDPKVVALLCDELEMSIIIVDDKEVFFICRCYDKGVFSNALMDKELQAGGDFDEKLMDLVKKYVPKDEIFEFLIDREDSEIGQVADIILEYETFESYDLDGISEVLREEYSEDFVHFLIPSGVGMSHTNAVAYGDIDPEDVKKWEEYAEKIGVRYDFPYWAHS